jgi:hypothetical protein
MSNDNAEESSYLEILEDKRAAPRVSSFVLRNIQEIARRTTISPFVARSANYSATPQSTATTSGSLSTEGDSESRSRNLKKEDNEDLIRILGPDYSDQFKSPYDTVDLIRFHEAVRDDGIVAAALDFLIQFMLGDHFKTLIDVNAEFDTEEEEKAARDAFNNNKQIRGYKHRIDQINREIRFQTHMFSLVLQCMIFGRACGLLERSKVDKLPIAIKILPSMHLGQVYVNRKTWNVIGVEHKDFKFPASILKNEDIIYFPLRDHNISPGTLHYGYSLLERIVDLSELNRITNQRNLKEINFRLWAAFLLIKLPGSYNKDTMRKLKDQLAKGAGNSVVVNQATEVTVQQIGHDMDKLLDQRDKNYREEIRQLQVPIILFDPDILNRATSQELMEAWTVSVLRSYRSWLKDIIQDQWINPILKTMIENEREQARLEENTDNTGLQTQEPQTQQETTDEIQESDNPNRTPDITKEVIPIEAIDPATNEVMVYRLNWKIKIEFEPLNYDTFKEKAETAILLKNNGLSTIGAALRRIGIEDENEIAALLQMEEERRELQFQMDAKALAGEAGDEDPTTQSKRASEPGKARSVERQRERFREELRNSVTGSNKGIVEGKRPIRGPPTKRGGVPRT